MLSRALVSMFESLTNGGHLCLSSLDIHVTISSPLRVAAGQADGIQPRTIEVLQVAQYFFAAEFVLTGVELWPCRSSSQPGSTDGHGRKCYTRYAFLLALTNRAVGILQSGSRRN
jgi:hypothetical protein